MPRSLVAVAAAVAVAASIGCAMPEVHAVAPSASGATCPGDHPIKVSKEHVVYGPWLRARYGSVAAVRCYDSVAHAVQAGARIVEQNK